MNKNTLFATLLLTACTLPMQTVHAGDRPATASFEKIVPALTGAPPEGFTIGRGSTAYNGSVDGSIYKVDLRSGEGEVLVPPEPDFDIFTQCYKLGMRVDPRSNYLFVAGCLGGNAYVFDAETGDEIANYELAPPFSTVINDLAITRTAVYFTDFTQPFLYRLPLSRNGRLPPGSAVMALPLSGDFPADDPTCCAGNGIVATPDGETLIVGNSNNAQIYRVDPATGQADRIEVSPPLVGFIDGIVLRDRKLYILTPDGDGTGGDWVQVVALDRDLRTGTLVQIITDPDMDGVASGAFFGGALYVNNARYQTFPEADTEYWLTRLDVRGKAGGDE
jgi:outer membrane protein assembly factor BamB